MRSASLLKEIPLWTPQVGEKRWSAWGKDISQLDTSTGSPIRKGQKNNICKLVRVTGGVQSQSCFFMVLVSFSH